MNLVSIGNLLSALPDASGGEQFEILAAIDGLRVERIVSKGQATSGGEWYDQTWHEWVMLVEGEALLLIEGTQEPQRLLPGGWVLLPAGCRHRVVWTPSDRNTVWLAVCWPVEKVQEAL